MRQLRRKGTSMPMCWLLFSITMGFLILRLAQAQPSHFFKANAPVSKSLPRIGRRSDLDTFPLPLPLSPSFTAEQQSSQNLNQPQRKNWPENFNFYRSDQNRQGRGDSSSIPFIDLDQLAPTQYNQYMWKKLMGEPEVSENGNMPLGIDDLMRNIYRSKTRK